MLRANSVPEMALAHGRGYESLGLAEQFQDWFREEGLWWLTSAVFHMALCCLLAIISLKAVSKQSDGLVLTPPPTDAPKKLPEIEKMEIPLESIISEIPPIDLLASDPPVSADNGKWTDTPGDEPPGGGPDGNMSFGRPDGNSIVTLLTPGAGPALIRRGRPGPGGSGCEGPGDGGFGPRTRHIIPPRAEKAVKAALNWIARHQLPDGRWSMQDYTRRCQDSSCTAPGAHKADTAATALALLPFLGAGETHCKGVYRETVSLGLAWLVKNQKSDGDLRGTGTMYAHALATIALCEAYGMTNDYRFEWAARRAVKFIEKAQNSKTGGWRYSPGEEGDTSVVGWQIMALKSAQMAGISVDPAVFERGRAFLNSVSAGRQGSIAGGQFAYIPGQAPTPSMTAVGLLCLQYMGMTRNDAVMVEGTSVLMKNSPEPSARDLYYWYYATQVIHNQPGPEWDIWNRKIRRILIDSQTRTGCAAGSWDPQNPVQDRWGDACGRLATTCLATLTLEVYYRYLPLYKTDREERLRETAPVTPAAPMTVKVRL